MTHIPVLLEEAIEYLNLEDGKTFVDATLDGGGHTKEIHARYPNVKMVGIEWDPVEFREFNEKNPKLASEITTVNRSYIELPAISAELQIKPDAILFDLGLSSWHYESSGRGFSFQRNEMLDMRFNPETEPVSAADLVNTSDPHDLQRILSVYGEEQFAKQIAEAIVKARQQQAITHTDQLVAVIKNAVPFWYTKRKLHWATKTFQALRVAVNHEMENVEQGIQAAIDVLNKRGRLVVISFQGMEDSIVRKVFKQNAQDGVIRWVTKNTIRPKWEEQQQNPRSRSAKMKIAEKL